MVWLGKKVFDMRQKLSVKRKLIPEDEEKPFLDHLEDLRKSLTRIIATLLIGMVACFIFKEEIFKIIERPINAADIGVMDKEQSPLGLKSPEEWPTVVGIAYGLLGLNEAQRGVFLGHAFTAETEHLRPVVEALLVRHAAQSLPAPAREPYIQAASGGSEPLLAIIRDMEKKKVDASFERGPKHMNLRFFKPGEGFNLSMKLSLYAGIVVGFPLLLYFLLEFIVPGLRPEERRLLWPSLVVGFGLFLTGVLFAYTVVTPNALRFLYHYDLSLGGTTEYRFTDYASFVVQFTLIFGLCFELPVIVYALNKLGILSYELMKNTRSYAIVIIVVIAALLTPTTDLINLSLLAVPMVFLYEMSIWIAYFHDKAVKKRELAEEEAERVAREARRERAAMAGAYLLDAPSGAAETSADTAHGTPGTEGPHDAHHPPFHEDHHAHDEHEGHGEQGRHDHATGETFDPTHDAEGRLTGPPPGEAESYHDRAAPWHGAPATDADEPAAASSEPPVTSGGSDQPPAAAEPAPASEAPASDVPAGEAPAEPAADVLPRSVTPGEPSGEASRHRD